MSPDGHCLYATSRAEGSLGYFRRDPARGALTFGGVVTEATSGVTGLADARGVIDSPGGNDIYVASPAGGGDGTRIVNLPGHIAQRATPGVTHLTFNGRIGGHRPLAAIG